MATKLLRLPAVVDCTGCNTTEIYAGMKAGTFPKSVPIGIRTRGWVEDEIVAWIEARIAQRDAGTVPENRPGPGRGHKGRRRTPHDRAAA